VTASRRPSPLGGSARRAGTGVVVALTILSAVVAAGCSDGSDGEPRSGTPSQDTTSASATTPGSPAAAPDVLPKPIKDDAKREPLAPLLITTRSLPGDPDWLVPALGSLWVKRDDGQVSKIQLASADPAGEITTGYSSLPTCQGLTFDGRSLWSCAGENKLAVLDPADLRLTRTVSAFRLSDQTRFPVGNGHVWVVQGDARHLVGVGIDDGKRGPRVPLEAFCTDLARPATANSATVYVVCPSDGKVLAVDTKTAKVTATVALDGALLASAGRRDVWVGFAGGLAQLDATDLSVQAVYDVPVDLFSSVWVDDDGVWVRSPGRELLTHIDPSRQAVDLVLTSPAYPSGGDVAITGGSLWTTASDDGVLLKIQLP
jgi:hypothetical protein